MIPRWWSRLVSRSYTQAEVLALMEREFNAGVRDVRLAAYAENDHLVAFYREWCEDLLRENETLRKEVQR